MNEQLITELKLLFVSFAVVTCLGAIAWVILRLIQRGIPPLPWKRPPNLWSLVDFLLLYLLYLIVISVMLSLLESSHLLKLFYREDAVARTPSNLSDAVGSIGGSTLAHFGHQYHIATTQRLIIWATLLAVPGFVSAVIALAIYVRGYGIELSVSRFIQELEYGLRVSLVIVPLILLIHVCVLVIYQTTGSTPVDHPMAILGAGNTWWETAVFWCAIAIAIPIVEELLFRGLLLRLCLARLEHVVIVFGLALLFALAPGFQWQPSLGPGLLVAIPFVLVLLRQQLGPTRRRRVTAALLANATLFAAVHTSVWPSPIPLLFLALGLAWLMLRTGRIIASIVLHGMFNSVSFVYLVLNGPAL